MAYPKTKTKTFSEAEIVRAARQIARGKRVREVCRELGISASTLMRWQRRYRVKSKLRREVGPTFSNADLRRETGLSREEIARYVRQRLLPPPFGFGSGAHFREEHLVRLRLLVLLKRAGMDRDEMHKILARLVPARERTIVRAAGKLAWGARKVRAWLNERTGAASK